MNHDHDASGYGLWTLVVINSAVFILLTYVRLAHREEREVAAELGEAWQAYAAGTPRWFPRLGGRPHGGGQSYAEGKN